jgi:predicted transcriptional regulator
MLGRRIVLIALVFLAITAVTALGAAADEDHDDWTIIGSEVRSDEVITVSGQLSIDLGGSLHLSSCSLIFTDGSPDDVRIQVRSGSLILDGLTTVIMENSGKMVLQGQMDIRGTVHFKHVDIQVHSRGTLAVRGADLTLEGSWSTPSVNDPLMLTVDGVAHITSSNINLVYAFIVSKGTITISGSSVEASIDWGKEYDGLKERLRFEQGVATLTDSTFSELYYGILSRADLYAGDCTFNASDLRSFAPTWQPRLEAQVRQCEFISSDLTVKLERTGTEIRELYIIIEMTTLDGGKVLLDLNDTFMGVVVLSNVSITGYSGYGLEVQAYGNYGVLSLDMLNVDGPRGVQVRGDFTDLELLNSTIRAQRTAIDFTGMPSPILAYIDNVKVWGEEGLVARNTVLHVSNSDLTGAEVAVRGEGGAGITLTDCLLDEDDIELYVAPGQRAAVIKVDRHLDIDAVRWDTDDTITDGIVSLYIFNSDLVTPIPPIDWRVGFEERPLIQLLEWSLTDDGEETYVAFTDVETSLWVDDHTFEALDTLNPWDEGPFQLVFHDDVNPWVSLDPAVSLVVTEPRVHLWGTVGDYGTGIDELRWTLHNSTGEEVASGPVDLMVNGKWSTVIDLTSNMQYVFLWPYDRTGNNDKIPTRAIRVDVSGPMLTIVRPEDGIVTNITQVTVAGSADWYADRVDVQVVGRPKVHSTQVVKGHFSMVLEIPEEGLNQLLVTSFDPFEGTDTKIIRVFKDSIAPELWFTTLEETSINHVNNPSLVVAGRTDDPHAVIKVNGQDVGLLEDSSFATTVHLLEGEQVVRVTAEDDAGNSKHCDFQVTLDTRRPVLTLISPEINPFWSNKDLVLVTVGLDEPVTFAELDGEPVTVTSGVISKSIMLGEGRTDLMLQVVDRAGNEATLSITLFRDKDIPSLTIESPKDGTIVNTTAVPIIVTTSEIGCTISADGITVDASEVSNALFEGTMYLGPGEGKRTIIVIITDRAGNTREKELTLQIDTIKPSVALPGFHEGKAVTTEPLKVKGYTEAGSKVVYVNGEMATLAPDGEFTITIELEEGSQTIKVLVIDRANNQGDLAIPVKVLGAPDFEVPVGALAAGTILLTMGAIVATTEAGRWSILVLFVPLYTKLRKEKILDQRTRGLIQGYVTANPGANYTIIRDNLDLADGTLTYHLQVLEREGYVYSIREGLFRCFYPQGVPPPKRGKLHLSDTQADIVRIVKRIPGITVGEIASAMKRRPNVISYHLKLLKEGGLVRMEEDGRHVRIYPIDTAVAMV